MHLLADATDFLKPPPTTDPVTWIAFAGVVVIFGLLIWQLRSSREERKESQDAYTTSLKTTVEKFSADLAAQRALDERRTEAVHERLNCIAEDVTAIRTKVEAA